MTGEQGGESHWSVLDPDNFNLKITPIEGLGEPEAAVPVPKAYGGDQEESEEAQLEKTEEGTFNIAKSKDEAIKQMKVLENTEEVWIEIMKL